MLRYCTHTIIVKIVVEAGVGAGHARTHAIFAGTVEWRYGQKIVDEENML